MGEMIPDTETMNYSIATNNDTLHYTPYMQEWSRETVTQISVLITLLVSNFCLNTSLIIALTKNKKQRKRRVNVFLLNLAIGDLAVCFTITTEILFLAFGEWVLGAVACKLIVYGQIVTLCSSTLLMTGMSIDRFQVVVQPMKSLRKRPKIWLKVTIAWFTAFLMAIPQLLIFVQVEIGVHQDHKKTYTCKSAGYTARWQRKIYITYLALFILVVPTIIMTYCYSHILLVLWKRGKGDDEDYLESSQPELNTRSHVVRTLLKTGGFRKSITKQNGIKSNGSSSKLKGNKSGLRTSVKSQSSAVSMRKAVKLTLSAIIGFIACWTPYFLISCIRIYSDYHFKLSEALAISEKIALVQSLLNPIFYAVFNVKLKRHCGSRGRFLSKQIELYRSRNTKENHI